MLDRISYKARGRMLACSTLKDKLQIYIQLRWSGPCKTQAHARNYCSFCIQKVQDTLYGTLTSQIRALWRSFPWQRDEVQRMHRYNETSAHHRFRAENRPPCAEYGWLGCSCRRISSRCQRMIPLTSFFDLVSAAAGARAVYAERKLQNFA